MPPRRRGAAGRLRLGRLGDGRAHHCGSHGADPRDRVGPAVHPAIHGSGRLHDATAAHGGTEVGSGPGDFDPQRHPTRGLANQVGDELVAEGWDGAAVGVGSRANASSQDIDKTVVYYSDPADEAAARALVLALKVGDVVLSDDFPGSPVTILIGSDYRPGV